MDVFNSHPGSVLRASGSNVVPLTVRLTDPVDFTVHRSIITAVGLHKRGNFQLLHTLRNIIYIYSFGDRVSDLIISGVSFSDPCTQGSHGLELMHEYYERNRLAQLGGPVNIAIGTTISLQALLIGVDLVAQDAQHLMSNFSMHFAVPNISRQP